MGATDGFEDFYRREYGRMIAIATALTGDPGAAEDLVQEAFFTAHRKWEQVGSYDEPGAFVRRVLVNRSRSRWRRRRTESAALARLATPDVAIDDEHFDDERFWPAVRSLSPRQAQCIVLRYVDDLDVAQIASIVGCEESTVRVHLHRARQTLASLLSLEEG